MLENLLYLIPCYISPFCAVMAYALYSSQHSGNPVWFCHRARLSANKILVHCKRCRYSLVGLSEDSVCPECGIDAPSQSEIALRGPREWSSSRLTIVPLIAAGSLLIGPCSVLHWNILWATSRWGPHPHFARLPVDYELFWVSWVALWMLLLAQICPWKMSFRQLVLVWAGGIAGLLLTNAAPIQWLWEIGDLIFLSGAPDRGWSPMWLVNPYLPIVGTGIGLWIASRVVRRLGTAPTRTSTGPANLFP
jgi:hypothetical protein